ncbi:GAF domain-containing protein [Pedobacter heparinus]|uniref:GAF domain-containing protein n=1 Tax=Pedobacter heparinus TaxID=984 RepID=UPI00292CE23C|nr:GAF domain-containing protein [Pedobacter heparinus]
MEKKIRKSIAFDEWSRLESLKNYKILYTKSAPVFDRLAAFTAKILKTPIALINFVDQDSVWLKEGQQARPSSPFEPETSLCSMAIINESGIEFEGFEKEPALMSNALIAGESGLRFYAAVPITTDEGLPVGMVCIVDTKHRKFLPHEQKKLEWVAVRIRKEMNKRMAGQISA